MGVKVGILTQFLLNLVNILAKVLDSRFSGTPEDLNLIKASEIGPLTHYTFGPFENSDDDLYWSLYSIKTENINQIFSPKVEEKWKAGNNSESIKINEPQARNLYILKQPKILKTDKWTSEFFSVSPVKKKKLKNDQKHFKQKVWFDDMFQILKTLSNAWVSFENNRNFKGILASKSFENVWKAATEEKNRLIQKWTEGNGFKSLIEQTGNTDYKFANFYITNRLMKGKGIDSLKFYETKKAMKYQIFPITRGIIRGFAVPLLQNCSWKMNTMFTGHKLEGKLIDVTYNIVQFNGRYYGRFNSFSKFQKV